MVCKCMWPVCRTSIQSANLHVGAACVAWLAKEAARTLIVRAGKIVPSYVRAQKNAHGRPVWPLIPKLH